MKILYHHRTLGDGAEGIHVQEMVNALRKLGHEVRVAALIGETTNVRTVGQKKWSRLARLLPGPLYEVAGLLYNVRGCSMLAREIRAFRPDFIYDRYVGYNYSAVYSGRRRGIPVLLEFNAPYSSGRWHFDEKVYFLSLMRYFERKIASNSSRVLVVSTPLREFLVSIGVPAERIAVVPNGADPDGFHPGIDGGEVRERHGLQGKLVIGFTGILRPWHGLELLVEAFSRVAGRRKEVHLLIVGDGPIRAQVEADAARRGVASRMTITGRIPHREVKSHVAAMDIAVSPRATPFASPMKIPEYMALAKAVVAPDMDNIRDLIVPGQDGLLFKSEDCQSLADRLRELVEDTALRTRLGTEARRTIETRRTWLHNARTVIRIAGEELGRTTEKAAEPPARVREPETSRG